MNQYVHFFPYGHAKLIHLKKKKLWRLCVPTRASPLHCLCTPHCSIALSCDCLTGHLNLKFWILALCTTAVFITQASSPMPPFASLPKANPSLACPSNIALKPKAALPSPCHLGGKSTARSDLGYSRRLPICLLAVFMSLLLHPPSAKVYPIQVKMARSAEWPQPSFTLKMGTSQLPGGQCPWAPAVQAHPSILRTTPRPYCAPGLPYKPLLPHNQLQFDI